MEEFIMEENVDTQIMPRLSKKIFVASKVYDTALMTDKEIRDAVQTDLDNYIGKGKVDFSIHIASNMVSLIFIRFTGYYKQNNVDMTKEMIDADAFMVTGESFGGSECQLSSRWLHLDILLTRWLNQISRWLIKNRQNYLGLIK